MASATRYSSLVVHAALLHRSGRLRRWVRLRSAMAQGEFAFGVVAVADVDDVPVVDDGDGVEVDRAGVVAVVVGVGGELVEVGAQAPGAAAARRAVKVVE